ncbi:MAG TPA: glutamyl-tRNA reductase [Planctomycetota bacterium]|jgi:glutamyl-tRNA reductase|nr:glutamyl-tRNA reductase [Planctomycetota bacterium]OQC20968.1 MAG: Glutamyl-tRNA reductase [Planctomycetes bacterium ADurb.Bin069]HNR98464.1 glutamyl-tRNA reductase [Planctomycetota bacterium]HNU25116.1 glutamyl-tRNA reductase [Planctomycetota bacterium]HOE30104.1 glutamyl-tRNA reductase [Planctomycetota bacterium]
MATRAAPAEFFLWGVSHRTAPLPVRELWALDHGEAARAAAEFHAITGGQVVVLATCNRTESYFYCAGEPPLAALEAALAAIKGRAVDPHGRAVFHTHAGLETVQHLFEVAGGLDSQILGETEIQGQVRDALKLAREAGACGADMGRLFDHALRAGKRVRSETRLSEGVLSAGQAGVLLAGRVVGDLRRVEALLIGSGEIGALTARALMAAGVRRLRVTSRTEEHARALARRFDAEAIPFQEAQAAMAASDLVVSSTSAPAGLFDKASLAPFLRRRAHRPLVVIDLAVPRDFAPDTAELECVFLHDLDDVEALVAQSQTAREAEIPRARLIVEEEARKFAAMHAFRLEVEPVVRAFVEAADAWQREELARRADELPPEARDKVAALVRRLVHKVLFTPLNRLKTLRNRGDLTPEALALVREIFEIETDGDDPNRHTGQ